MIHNGRRGRSTGVGFVRGARRLEDELEVGLGGRLSCVNNLVPNHHAEDYCNLRVAGTDLSQGLEKM